MDEWVCGMDSLISSWSAPTGLSQSSVAGLACLLSTLIPLALLQYTDTVYEFQKHELK